MWVIPKHEENVNSNFNTEKVSMKIMQDSILYSVHDAWKLYMYVL